MGIKCKINLNLHVDHTYIAGQQIVGTVEISAKRKKKIKAISAIIYGHATTDWKKHEAVYTGRVDYLNHTTYLLGSPESIEVMVQPGTHTFQFSYLLSQDLPSSFNGIYGKIQYGVIVKIEHLSGHQKKYKIPFTVQRHLDLNDYAIELAVPVKKECIKQFWLNYKSKPLILQVTLPASGFIAEQKIPILVNIDNRTNGMVYGLKIEFLKTVTYTSQTITVDCREVTEKIGKHKQPVNVGVEEVEEIQLNFPIPNVPATDTMAASIIKITYVLKVKIKAFGISNNCFVEFPIMIGTIPLRDSLNNTAAQMPLLDAYQQNNSFDRLALFPLAPPSYEEAIGEYQPPFIPFNPMFASQVSTTPDQSTSVKL